jgi:transcriptional antiterminator NusG
MCAEEVMTDLESAEVQLEAKEELVAPEVALNAVEALAASTVETDEASEEAVADEEPQMPEAEVVAGAEEAPEETVAAEVEAGEIVAVEEPQAPEAEVVAGAEEASEETAAADAEAGEAVADEEPQVPETEAEAEVETEEAPEETGSAEVEAEEAVADEEPQVPEAEVVAGAEEAPEETAAAEAEEAVADEGPQAPEAEIEAETEVETEVEAEAEPVEVEVPDDGRAWYVIHCYSGYEAKVKHNLEQRIETMQMQDQIFQVVVPTEDEIEVRDGKRRVVERRVFPGYILVQMLLNDDSWYVVRNTPGVTGFVGMGNEPTPLRPEEVQGIMKRMEAEAPKIKVTFRSGQKVRIIDGPFNEFIGVVDEIDMERAKVRVLVSFFGRETPVELDFLQVEKT